jgi:hypothetical protein
VQTLGYAASHPFETISGDSESQNVPDLFKINFVLFHRPLRVESCLFYFRPTAVIRHVPVAGEESNLSPTIPDTIRSKQKILMTSRDSSNKTIPSIATPTAPIPVQIAYAVPTGIVFIAID